ncbi:hypothetical protein ACO0LG_17740 [Undibacterium sp. Ji42W]|uniref:hypothetical protein n=1 Tax=Undibacterium sp. Ji42W TaxID=3413039 RepID=UPI003BEFE19A
MAQNNIAEIGSDPTKSANQLSVNKSSDWYKPFGRVGDQAGMDYWDKEIASKGYDTAYSNFLTATAQNMASGKVVGADSISGQNFTNKSADWYTPFGRIGDQAGIDYWNNEIKNKGYDVSHNAFLVAAAQNLTNGKGVGSGNIQSTETSALADTKAAGTANGMPTAEYLAAQNARMAALGNVGGPYQAGELGMPGASARPDYEQKLAALRMQSELATAAANRQKQMAAKPFDSVQSSGMYSSDPLIDMQRRIAEAQSMNPAQQDYLKQQMSQLTPQQLQQLGGIDEQRQTYAKAYNNGAYNNAQQQLFNQRQAYGMAGFDAPVNPPQVPVVQQQQQNPYIQPFQQANAYSKSVNMNWGSPDQPRAQAYWGNEGQAGNWQTQSGQSNPYLYSGQSNNFQSPFSQYQQNPYGIQNQGSQSNFQQPMGLLNQGFTQQQPTNSNQNRYGLLSAYGSR